MFLDAQGQLQQHHFPLYQKTDLQPLTDASNNNALYRNRNEQPDHVPAPCPGDREPAVLRARACWSAATSSRRASTTATRRRTWTRFAVDDVNLTFRSLPAAAAQHGHDFQHAAPPGARGDVDGVLRPGLVHDRPAEPDCRDPLGAVEGYLPAQTTPLSRFFPDGLVFQGVNIGG
jgi:hypothetical protein